MRTYTNAEVILIEADEFGVIGIKLAEKLTAGENKRTRKIAFNRLRKLYALAFPGNPHGLLTHISIGTDSNGLLILYFHHERAA